MLGTMTDDGERHFRSSRSLNLTIFIGLYATVSMCLTLGPFVVPTHSDRMSQNAILFGLVVLCGIAMIIAALMAIRYIRKQDKFHFDQTVFWPTRCFHCARLLNLEGTLLRTDQENQPGSDSDNEGVTNPNSNRFSSNLIQDTCHASGSNHCLISISRMNYGNSQESFKGNTKHRALINILSVFCFVCGAGLFVRTIREFLCYAHGDISIATIIGHSANNFVIICALPIIISFAKAYADAVFLDSYQNLLTITLILSVSIQQCASRMFRPIGKLLRHHYADLNVTVHSSWGLNNTLSDVFDYIELTVSPMYTETSITLLAISLQLWNSFVSKTSTTLESDQVLTREYYHKLSLNWVRELLLKLKTNFAKFAGSCRCTRRKNEALMTVSSSPPFSRTLYIAWTLLIVANVPYLGFSLYFVYRSHDIYYSFHEICIMWSLEIVFSLSFCVLCTYEKRRKCKLSQRSGKRSDSPVTKLRSHEIMLLICGIGIFSQCIFLVMAAAGILMSNQLVDRDEYLSCVIAIVYSAVKVLMVWQMTAFLIRVPRRKFDSEIENGAKKRVLVCLINVMVVCGIQWVILTLEGKIFMLQKLYYGDAVGEAIDVLLEPFGTIYGLHAVMMAYELYNDILSQSMAME